MATGKRYYWIKLRESFMNSDTVDFLMSQKEGANYVVLYQMLCLKTINTGGRLSRQIGEYLIPYDVEKIQRDCKWFSADTIRVALNLYKGCGLIYEDVDGVLVLAEHENMVGSETDYAEKNRRIRAKQQAIIPDAGHNVSNDVSPNVTTDIRDKSTDTRFKSKEDVVVGNPFGNNDNDRPKPDPLVLYATNNLMYMSPYNIEELISFRDVLPDEVIRYAIDQACANGVRKYNYVKVILNSYVEHEFKTIGDIEAHEAQRQKGGSEAKQYADEDNFY